MLKLCLALAIFYPVFGGGPLRFMRYQPGLRKRDVHARVLAGTARKKDALHTSEDLDWDAYPIGAMLPIDLREGIPVHRVRLPSATSVRRTSTYFRALIDLCRDPATRPDVIQLHSFERLESLFWLRRLKRLEIPIVYAIQIARPVERKSRLARVFKRPMLRIFYNGFDGIVTSSEQIAGYLRGLGVRSPIAVIPNGVDLAEYHPGDEACRKRARERLGIVGSGPVILSVGAVSPRKGSDLLISAWLELLDRHPEAELALVGPRPDHSGKDHKDFAARIEALIAHSPHPERVHLTGLREDLSEIYAAADLVVVPTAREGGTPNVVLEAMACERPVLITPFVGQSKAIGRPGIEFEQTPRNPSALAEAMGDLLDDSERCAELVERARSWVVDNLDINTSLDRFADFYRRAAEGRLCAEEIESENPVFSRTS
ncbi:MAG: hypothetical protein CL908_21915 [Deltaproteobacteria bacterium]|nr:hypothetical protein [Deltaproteobacteria bacterium]